MARLSLGLVTVGFDESRRIEKLLASLSPFAWLLSPYILHNGDDNRLIQAKDYPGNLKLMVEEDYGEADGYRNLIKMAFNDGCSHVIVARNMTGLSGSLISSLLSQLKKTPQEVVVIGENREKATKSNPDLRAIYFGSPYLVVLPARLMMTVSGFRSSYYRGAFLTDYLWSLIQNGESIQYLEGSVQGVNPIQGFDNLPLRPYLAYFAARNYWLILHKRQVSWSIKLRELAWFVSWQMWLLGLVMFRSKKRYYLLKQYTLGLKDGLRVCFRF
jgi:hypothetical protein